VTGRRATARNDRAGAVPTGVTGRLGLEGAALLAAPATGLRGIGPAIAAALAERGVRTVEDVLWLLPRRYDDARRIAGLADALAAAVDGERVTARAEVRAARMVFVRGRRWAEVRLGEGGAELLVRVFGAHGGLERRFPVGASIALSGPAKRRGARWEMANPDVLGSGDGAGVLVRYPDIPGVPAATLRAACRDAVARVGAAADDGVPPAVLARTGMPALAEALAVLHAPADELGDDDVAALIAGTSRWHRRVVWGELFGLGAVVARRRRAHRAEPGAPCPPPPGLAAVLAAALPFAPTAAQRRAIDEIGADLAAATPMNRLLQGDVGTGKTAVAFAALLQVARAGRQAALMVPTEILAEQHHATLAAWAARAGLGLALLTASTPRLDREAVRVGLAVGAIDAVVGTHALLTDDVDFARLALVVVDEQHRFGVGQRLRLRDKGGQGAMPHLLVMTATPIPRTLALTAYGDLDATILDERPPGRVPVSTRALAGARGRAQAYRRVAARVLAGERAFVVCPRVGADDGAGDDGDGAGGRDATGVHAELVGLLAPARVGLVHGRLASAERAAVMAAFAGGDLDVLVATTVIEVGVDVPAATVLVVEDADRFGLAQLHQLRGRIGRGPGGGECLLLHRGAVTDEARRRLDVMVEADDGFRIAEEDLIMRGPGELLGTRQAGLPRLRFGDLREHTELLLAARAEAEQVIADDPDLLRPEHQPLRAALDRRLGGAGAGAESG
jgi:ATP-dependent DNA helicase RecG